MGPGLPPEREQACLTGQRLLITREIGDRSGEETALWNLSLALDGIGDRPGA
jgi:hypothetical protein